MFTITTTRTHGSMKYKKIILKKTILQQEYFSYSILVCCSCIKCVFIFCSLSAIAFGKLIKNLLSLVIVAVNFPFFSPCVWIVLSILHFRGKKSIFSDNKKNNVEKSAINMALESQFFFVAPLLLLQFLFVFNVCIFA